MITKNVSKRVPKHCQMSPGQTKKSPQVGNRRCTPKPVSLTTGSLLVTAGLLLPKELVRAVTYHSPGTGLIRGAQGELFRVQVVCAIQHLKTKGIYRRNVDQGMAKKYVSVTQSTKETTSPFLRPLSYFVFYHPNRVT